MALSEREFIDRVATEFGLTNKLSITDSLVQDLLFDSFDVIMLLMYIEEITGARAATNEPEDFPIMSTVRDAYLYYCVALDGQAVPLV